MKESDKTKFISLMTWWVKEFLKLYIITLIVVIGWQQLELHMLGEIRPNNVDTIIALILTVSLYMHVKEDC